MSGAIRRADDLALLADVIEAGSFTLASRLTGMSKSLLSRRIQDLEAELRLRLIERTTRSFRVTDAGQRVYRHGLAVRDATQAVNKLADDLAREPAGVLRVACPVSLADLVIGDIAVRFVARHPSVQLTFDVDNGLSPKAGQPYDIWFTASTGKLPNSEMIARRLMLTPYVLVATRGWMEQAKATDMLGDVQGKSGIGWWQDTLEPHWGVVDADGERHDLMVHPKMLTNNLAIAKRAALAGIGVARLPLAMCRDELADGTLCRVLPSFEIDPIAIYVTYPSRDSLTSAGRSFLAMLSEASLAMVSFGARRW